MKFTKAISIVFLALFVMSIAGCVTIDAPVSATSNPVGSKVGEASGQVILNLFGDVQAGIRTAAANGGITEISTVDFEVDNMLNVITTYTTTVTGE